jgi:multidrug efflux pump subunit AcrB
VFWKNVPKEEMPEFAMNWVRIAISYPGASAADVELFITKPVEEKLKGLSGYLFVEKMKFVMFPREESQQIAVRVEGPEGLQRREMALFVSQVENLFIDDPQQVVVGMRTYIGQSRRGGQVRENEASLRVELLPPSEREVSLNQLIKAWEAKAAEIEGLADIRFLRSRFGSESGSPIEQNACAISLASAGSQASLGV